MSDGMSWQDEMRVINEALANPDNEDTQKRLRQMGDDARQSLHDRKGDMLGREVVTGVNEWGLPIRTRVRSKLHPEGSWEGCPTCKRQESGLSKDDYQDPDDNIDPFDPRLIGAALDAVKHADAIMRTAAFDTPDFGNNVPAHPGNDQPHNDWQPRWGAGSTTEKWHPPFGETHVKYHVYQLGGGRNPVFWRANHHGTYQGRQMVSDPTGNRPDIETSKYSTGDEPERVMNWSRRGDSNPLNFRSIDDAKAAAEEHYKENYGQPVKHDYDIDSIMNEHDSPAPRSHGLGDDEDYGHIFGMHRRMAAKADAVSESVRMRIAAELSPPCPDCGQVAGFEPHMVSPRIKACRNCGWTMTDYGVDDLLNETLRGHDREVSDLPETDHPTLGRHGARKPKNPFGSDPRFSHQTTCNVCGQAIYGDPREIEDRNPKSEWVDRTGDTGADETEHVRAHDHWPVELA